MQAHEPVYIKGRRNTRSMYTYVGDNKHDGALCGGNSYIEPSSTLAAI